MKPGQLAEALSTSQNISVGPNLPVEIWENILYRQMRDELCSAPLTQFKLQTIQAMAEKLKIPQRAQDNAASLCRDIAAHLASFGEQEYQKQKSMNAQTALNTSLWNVERLGLDIRGLSLNQLLIAVQELG